MQRARRPASVEDPDDVRAAEEVAVRILNGAAQSATALQHRLRQRGFSPLAARVAADRCREHGYVNDAALAASLVGRMQRAGRGRSRIAVELRRRGIAADAVEAALGPAAAGADDAAALDVGRKLLHREMARVREDGGARRRVAAALQRRGFAASVIAHTLRTLSEEAHSSSE